MIVPSTQTALAGAEEYATMSESSENVVEFPSESSSDVLTGLLRKGACKLLADAIEQEQQVGWLGKLRPQRVIMAVAKAAILLIESRRQRGHDLIQQRGIDGDVARRFLRTPRKYHCAEIA